MIFQNMNTRANLNGNRYSGDQTPIYLNQSSLNGYFEYGLLKKTSVGFAFSAANKRVDDKVFGINTNKNNLDIFEIFGKRTLAKFKHGVIATQATVGIPIYKEYSLHPTQANYKPNWSSELRLMFGLGSGDGNLVESILGDSGSFINFELGYKVNSNGYSYSNLASDFDEVKSQLDVGFAVKDENLKMILLQLFKTNRLYKQFNQDAGITGNGFTYNDITQFLGSALFDIGDRILFQFGLFYEVRSTLIGRSEDGNMARGLVLGLWL